MSKYKITTPHVDERLDKFLIIKFKKLSRAQIQKNIKNGLYLVNGKKVAPHYFLKEKDVIVTNDTEQATSDKNKIKVTPTFRSDILPDIIFETKDYLVINKPEGLLVHPDNVHQEITLIDWLIKKYPSIKKVYDKENQIGKLRPGIVHRIDRDVSGLMVIAKTQPMFDFLKNQFKDRIIKKEYLALVHGVVSLNEGTIKRVIYRSAKSGLMVTSTNENAVGKEAITEFEVLKRFQHFTLLKIKLLTGRTHQIRVHLKSIGHSILGDKLYVTRDIRLKHKKVIAPNIFLLSCKLGFLDLDNNWQEFKIKEPKWWLEYLKTLKS